MPAVNTNAQTAAPCHAPVRLAAAENNAVWLKVSNEMAKSAPMGNAQSG